MTNPHTPPQDEPTVLDLYKSVTKDWASFFNFARSLWDAGRRAEINHALVQEAAHSTAEEFVETLRASHFPWRSSLALAFALAAQVFIEPPNRQATFALALYLMAVGAAVWAYFNNEWRLPALPAVWQTPDNLSTRLFPLIISVILALIAFVDFGDGLFSLTNTFLWIISIGLLVNGLWLKTPKFKAVADTETRRRKIIWNLLVLGVLGLSIFFRLYKIDVLPVEPFSDHAEKILDVYDITQGKTSIFFERNTGREAFQMYWTLLIANVFGTGLSFFSLKLGTALLGILTLPYIYLLGKEFGNQRAGLFALFLFGIAYWPNVISRIGLRFPLYALFAAPTLLYLIRGLRTRNRNDFLLSGIFLGFGLHGYSPFRVVPLLVLTAIVIFILHTKSKETRQQAVWWFIIIVVVSLFMFLPLFRYWLEHPAMFGYRAFSRLSGVEAELPGPAWQIFLSNLYNGLLMFNWDNGEIWVNSIPHRPALDVVTGALFVLGVVLLVVRYIRQRDWRDLFLLVSIPMLIMPSVLSLAFPGENPALNRAGGAAVAAILVSALALEGLVAGFGAARSGKRAFVAYSLTGLLFVASAYNNYDLVFNKFDTNFRLGAWNTSEMGQVISQFRGKYGQTDTVWIVPFPHWVDTRLPGVWAGIPNRDFALWPENFAGTLNVPAPKMFIFWNADLETENALKELYPNGVLNRYTSATLGKDFMIFMVER
ncbi:MAG TPA: glycosyltransferase family 39 protein [Anaerolineales bacterium]|nr:glycosyltransferase family 39 protein [Anaerolineales bacterium]